MTVESTTRSVGYTGNGVTTVFAYNFRIIAASHLVVRQTDTDGAVTTLDLGVDYTVSGVGEAAGGAITLLSPLTLDYALDIERVVPYLQQTDLSNHGAFLPQIHEDAFDFLCMQIQQVYAYASALAASLSAGLTAIPTYTLANRPAASAALLKTIIYVKDAGAFGEFQIVAERGDDSYGWATFAILPPT